MSWHFLHGYGRRKLHQQLRSINGHSGRLVLEFATVELRSVAVDFDNTQARLLKGDEAYFALLDTPTAVPLRMLPSSNPRDVTTLFTGQL